MAKGNYPAKRRKVWSAIPSFTANMTADNTFAIASVGNFAGNTVLRMLGEYGVAPTSAPSTTDQAKCTIGIGVVSTDAFNVGASAMPDPAGEPGYPWLYWAEHPLFYSATTQDAASAVGTVRQAFDIKSMRKVTDRQSLVFIFQYTDILGAPPLTMAASQTRVLIALA